MLLYLLNYILLLLITSPLMTLDKVTLDFMSIVPDVVPCFQVIHHTHRSKFPFPSMQLEIKCTNTN